MKGKIAILLLVFAVSCLGSAVTALIVANRITSSSISIVRDEITKLGIEASQTAGGNPHNAAEHLYNSEKRIALSMIRVNIVHDSYFTLCVGTIALVCSILLWARGSGPAAALE